MDDPQPDAIDFSGYNKTEFICFEIFVCSLKEKLKTMPQTLRHWTLHFSCTWILVAIVLAPKSIIN